MQYRRADLEPAYEIGSDLGRSNWKMVEVWQAHVMERSVEEALAGLSGSEQERAHRLLLAISQQDPSVLRLAPIKADRRLFGYSSHIKADVLIHFFRAP